MLVVQRKVGERIMVGDDIVITVTEVRAGGKVRLGFSAPPNVRIDREEIWNKIQQEKMDASNQKTVASRQADPDPEIQPGDFQW